MDETPHPDRSGLTIIDELDFDGGRTVTMHLPAGEPTSIVFAADGAEVVTWAADLGGTRAANTVVVGIGGLADARQRLPEYSPVFDADRFAAHEWFFTADVVRWAAERIGRTFPVDRCAVFGVSAGGELALALGLGHPDLYGAILCGSPGAGYRPPLKMPGTLPKTYLVAGHREEFFLANAARWADALVSAGGEVRFARRDGEHGTALWRREFPAMIEWAFPNGEGPSERFTALNSLT